MAVTDPAASLTHHLAPAVPIASVRGHGSSDGDPLGEIDRVSGPKEFMEVDGGHFGLSEYPSEAFDRASRAQADFLARTLGVAE